jgi:hypothetical protein
MAIALVCIAKNEDRYIAEWLDYHRKLGFNRFFIYENDWRCSLDASDLTKIPWDGKVKQIPAYSDFLKNRSQGYEFAMFMDVDEFLVLKDHQNIHQFAKAYRRFPAVGISWVLFGDSGHESVVDGHYGVVERFTRCAATPHPHVKSLLNLKHNNRPWVHAPLGQWASTDKVIHRGQSNPNPTTIAAQINHYFCKTRQEFNDKLLRGRMSRLHPFRDPVEFDLNNHNDIIDTTARDFLYPPTSKDNQ